ncbi:MAG: hypothetical protein GX933_07740 [Chloroflexi bacterium]|nr:hypothetical protein [Chloroflexota bacterium]
MKILFQRKPLILIPLLAGLYLFLSYGLSICKLGIYWDDWVYLWTKFELGYDALVRHFSFSRPLAGQIQNLVMSLTGTSTVAIQLYGLIMRLICSSLVGILVYRVFSKQPFAAIAAACLFSIYPGFSMQPIALNFGFSYLLLSLLIISFLFTLKAAEQANCSVLYSGIALVLTAINLFASEYFFLLELIRPLLLWCWLANHKIDGKSRLKKCLEAATPYLVLFLTAVLYRIFFNRTQTLHYDFSLISALKTDPVGALGTYFSAIFRDLYSVLFSAWALPFSLPASAQLGQRTYFVFWGVIVASLLAGMIALWLIREEKGAFQERQPLQLMLIGIMALVLAGQPFWLTGSYLNFVFPNSRYTLPFLLGMAFFLTGLLWLLSKFRFGKMAASITMALLVSFSVGYHFRVASEYRRDWNLTGSFFEQLKWRIPSLKEETVIITNVLPIRFSTDNSLTAPLNWIYSVDSESELIPYMLYTNTKRAETLSKFKPGQKIEQEYLSARFEGNTENAISLYFQNPGCVHVLDPEVDVFNQTLPLIDREAALLNNYQRINKSETGTEVVKKFFGSNDVRSWCWYYQKADLARQFKDWESVAQLGDKAFALADHPNDAIERVPFIEGYAHMNRWEDAATQSKAMLKISPLYNDVLCALWQRIDRETPDSASKSAADQEIGSLLNCEFLTTNDTK